MQLGLAASSSNTSQSGEAHPKRVAVASKTEGMGEQLTAVTKLALDGAQKMRTQRACTLLQYRVEATHMLVQEASRTTQSFIEKQKALKLEGKNPEQIKDALGHPSNHITNRWLQLWLATLSPEEKAKEEAIICKWQGGWRALQREVPHLKVCRMYGGATKRIEVALPYAQMVERHPAEWSNSVTRSFLLAFASLGKEAVPMEGAAPPSDLERQLQRMLDAAKPKD